MGNYRKLWFTLIGVLIVTFSLLGYYGAEVYRTAPPIPAKITTAGGEVLYTHDSILDGQTAWQSVGGMQLGSIWGHGAYQAPDWTADWLHRYNHHRPHEALGRIPPVEYRVKLFPNLYF